MRDKPVKAWTCTICGHIDYGDQPPAECPICGADRELLSKDCGISEIKKALRNA